MSDLISDVKAYARAAYSRDIEVVVDPKLMPLDVAGYIKHEGEVEWVSCMMCWPGLNDYKRSVDLLFARQGSTPADHTN